MILREEIAKFLYEQFTHGFYYEGLSQEEKNKYLNKAERLIEIVIKYIKGIDPIV